MTLRWTALVLAAAAAAILAVPVWADSGTFAIWGLGLPVALCIAPIVAGPSRYSDLVAGTSAVAQLAWAVLLALGVGLYFLPAALVELAAAVRQPRAQRRPV
jgi:hypothetical protein